MKEQKVFPIYIGEIRCAVTKPTTLTPSEHVSGTLVGEKHEIIELAYTVPDTASGNILRVFANTSYITYMDMDVEFDRQIPIRIITLQQAYLIIKTFNSILSINVAKIVTS